jgi:hypothetical protein
MGEVSFKESGTSRHAMSPIARERTPKNRHRARGSGKIHPDANHPSAIEAEAGLTLVVTEK